MPLRFLSALILGLFAASGGAAAQDQPPPSRIELVADPVPIVEATINNQVVRIEVDPSFPDFIVFNADTAARLELQNVPMAVGNAQLDDARITGNIVRPRVKFEGRRTQRVFGGVFPTPGTARADAVMGPGVLPFDQIVIRFGAGAGTGEGVARTIALEDPDIWRGPVEFAPGVTMDVFFTLSRPDTIFNRPGSAALEAARLIEPAGELARRELLLGLSTQMQPLRLDPRVALQGLALGPVLARTGAPLLGASMEDAVIVLGENENAPPAHVVVGSTALAACFELAVDRNAKTMTLRCAR